MMQKWTSYLGYMGPDYWKVGVAYPVVELFILWEFFSWGGQAEGTLVGSELAIGSKFHYRKMV